jgi:hypothetical protein
VKVIQNDCLRTQQLKLPFEPMRRTPASQAPLAGILDEVLPMIRESAKSVVLVLPREDVCAEFCRQAPKC